MPSTVLLDTCGRRRSPATLPSFHQGWTPRNKGQRYPADPPTVEEIIAVMQAAGDDADGVRLRGLIVMLWRAGLRISEALALTRARSGPQDPGNTAISPAYPTRRPRNHIGIPARDRQHRDRPRRPRAAGANDPGHPRPLDLALT
jgi:hypothetical protein